VFNNKQSKLEDGIFSDDRLTIT